MERREVIIVGSGPAGAATALGIVSADPSLAAATVMLEKGRHPRDKTCAGGVIPKAVGILAGLEVPFDVPQVRVDRAKVDVPGQTLAIPGDDICRVVRRRELDAHLAWAARDRGVELREDERVVAIARDGRGVRVETSRTAYWAPVVVGADGSGSLVRRALVDDAPGCVGRGLMVDVPCDDLGWDGHERHRYDFDFRCVTAGVRGYRWVFPCLIAGRPHANVGVYALPPITGARLQEELRSLLAELGGRIDSWKAFPVRTHVRGRIAGANVLLVGDAAGCDPLLGEGISYALEYGVLAAKAIVEANRSPRADFADYQRAVDRGALGRKLSILRWAVRAFYGPVHGAAFRLTARSRRAQRFGLAWYNGLNGADELGWWAMARALLATPREAEGDALAGT